MENMRDKYMRMIEIALKDIKCLRNQPLKDDIHEYAELAMREQLFDFGGNDSSYYKFLVKESEDRAKKMVYETMAYILSSKLVRIEPFDNQGIRRYVIEEDGRRTLYILKDHGLNNHLPMSYVQRLMAFHKSVEYMYISYTWAYAYTEAFNSNDNEADPARGGKSISVYDFLARYIPDDELETYKRDVCDFANEVKGFIGLDVIRTLQPITLYKFKRRMKAIILNFDYRTHLADISDPQRRIIEEQFFDERLYTTLVSRTDYAESMITAEWLYDSFGNAGKIDYTVVALGYFKAIEQLLWRYIQLHRNEEDAVERKMRRQDIDGDTKYLKTVADRKTGKSKLIREKYVPINDENIKEERLDTTLGSMINSFFCFKKNKDLIRNDIEPDTVEYIYKLLKSIRPLRNGYFHKHNLDNWESVEEVRTLAYKVAYILLGAFVVREKDYSSLQVEERKQLSDYHRLCEYILDYPNRIYHMDLKGSGSSAAYTCRVESVYNEYGDVSFGKITLNEIEISSGGVKISGQYSMTEKNLPDRIYSARMNVFDAMDENRLNFERLLNGEKELVFDSVYCAPDPDEASYQY